MLSINIINALFKGDSIKHFSSVLRNLMLFKQFSLKNFGLKLNNDCLLR